MMSRSSSAFAMLLAFIASYTVVLWHGEAMGGEIDDSRAVDFVSSCNYYPGSFYTDIQFGSTRSLSSLSSFLPLACDPQNLVFSDFRLKRDQDNNREGNFGLGIRRLIKHSRIIGAYSFYDRKKSGITGKYHTQATVGAELLADSWDLRANHYIPVTRKKSVVTGPPVGLALSAPYLYGTGVYVAETGALTRHEKPMSGADIEFGIQPQFLESLWLHAAGYRFSAGEGATLSGIRGRMTYDLTPNISLVAEGQWDDERGKQGWVGFRFSYAFGADSSLSKGIKSRMISLPVRDVDIVTDTTITGNPVEQVPVINTTTGDVQRIIYVDNSAVDTGDGSIEHPYKSLASAQAVLQDHDIVYLHYGDGTALGQDAGIKIEKTGVMLIGEGSAFIYDGGKFSAGPRAGDFTGTTLIAAGSYPIITNTAIDGSGVAVAGDGTVLSGFIVDGASKDGISILNASASLSNLIVRNNIRYGLYALSEDGHRNLTAEDIISESNFSEGIYIRANGNGGGYDDISINGVTSRNNAINGLLVQAASSGTISAVNMRNIGVSDNGQYGSCIISTGAGSKIDNVYIDELLAQNNLSTGLRVEAASAGAMSSVELKDIFTGGQTASGVYLTSGGVGSYIQDISIDGLQSQNNTGYGLLVQASSSSSILSVNLRNISTSWNTYNGTIISASGSTIGAAVVDTLNANNNLTSGFLVQAVSSGSISSIDLKNIDAFENQASGVQVLITGAGSQAGDLLMDNVVSHDNVGHGVIVSASAGGDISSADLQNLSVSNNGYYGVHVLASGAGSWIGETNINDIVTNNNSGTGVFVRAASSGVMDSAYLRNIISYGNSSYGAVVSASGASAYIGAAFVDALISHSNTGSGLLIQAISSGQMASAELQNINTYDNAGNGVAVSATIDGAQMGATYIDTVLSQNNTGVGLAFQATTSGSIASIDLKNATIINNKNYGVFVSAVGSGSYIGDAVLQDMVASGNTGRGLWVESALTGNISSVGLLGATVSYNSSHGVYFSSADAGSQIGSVYIDALNAHNNTGNGLRMQTYTSGSIASTDLRNSVLADNTSVGLYLYSYNNGTLTDFLMQDSVINNNGSYGVYINDDTSGAVGFDLGGGIMGGLGRNSIFDNVDKDIRVDLDGANLSARYNWWGTPLGLQAGEQIFDDGSSIDASEFLLSSP